MTYDDKALKNYFWIVLMFGIMIGLLIAALLQINCTSDKCTFQRCEQESITCTDSIGCGRGFVDECPSACYDSRTDSFLRFEHTDTNLNIIIETNNQQSTISMPGFVVEEYWVEDGYYYADIDNIQITE
jgi:hypothetical protein